MELKKVLLVTLSIFTVTVIFTVGRYVVENITLEQDTLLITLITIIVGGVMLEWLILLLLYLIDKYKIK